MHLIVGGTGALGSAVARRLLAAGEPVRVMTRAPERAGGLAAAGAEVVRGDLLARDALAGVCHGAETVVAAAHSLLGRGRSASAHVDGKGHRALVDAAAAAGVRHFVYTSVQDYGPAYQEVAFFRIKRAVEAHLAASGMRHTILRPTAFLETHAHLLIGEPILRGRRVVLFGRGERPRNFVAADDVAWFAVRALGDPALAGETLPVGGPGNPTNRDVVRLYERAAGRRAKITHVPLGPLRLVARLLRPLHPGLGQVLQLGILAETTDQRFDARPLVERFPVELTSAEAWVSRKVSVAGRAA